MTNITNNKNYNDSIWYNYNIANKRNTLPLDKKKDTTRYVTNMTNTHLLWYEILTDTQVSQYTIYQTKHVKNTNIQFYLFKELYMLASRILHLNQHTFLNSWFAIIWLSPVISCHPKFVLISPFFCAAHFMRRVFWTHLDSRAFH